MSTRALGPCEADVRNAERAWQERDGTARLWACDASLWTGGDEDAWLGWLQTASESQARLPEWRTWADALRNDGVEDVVVLGMGGSSLCPEVLAQTFGQQPRSPRLRVLDSTVPAQIRQLAESIDLARTLFVVSSKSGTTIEADVLLAHWFAAAQSALGAEAARHFIAITDRGTVLERLAADRQFRHTEYGVASIGGRFSALSPFGMLPAALAGLDVGELLTRAKQMEGRCRPESGDSSNPGVQLGIAIAAHARAGRDKLTLVASPGLAAIGTWFEQLVAESTGKGGQGVVPIAGEALVAPNRYANDRLFVYARLATAASAEQDAGITALEEAGQPVVRLDVADPLEGVAEFYRWEFAIAVASSLLGLHPFDQPDVEAAKIVARQLTDGFLANGALPSEPARKVLDGVALYGDTSLPIESKRDLESLLAAHFERIAPGDYFALNAFVAMTPRNQASLRRICTAAGGAGRAATMLGFGPRFLHSTGQLHKGGPNTGVFLQITTDDAPDLEIPERGFSFGVLKQAQALGDFQVLTERGRRVLRLHVGSGAGPGVEAELERIAAIAERATRESTA